MRCCRRIFRSRCPSRTCLRRTAAARRSTPRPMASCAREGCGIVVLKRLSDAVADGDNMLAVIRGSAVNQDGRSSGITAPNGAAQEAVIRQALANARLQRRAISITWKRTARALRWAIPSKRTRWRRLLGAGRDPHAAGGRLGQNQHRTPGIGGRHRRAHQGGAVAAAGTHSAAPALPADESAHRLEGDAGRDSGRTARSGSAGSKPRLAGVSSFGFSGTNAHVIMEEAPRACARRRARRRARRACAGDFGAQRSGAGTSWRQRYRGASCRRRTQT